MRNFNLLSKKSLLFVFLVIFLSGQGLVAMDNGDDSHPLKLSFDPKSFVRGLSETGKKGDPLFGSHGNRGDQERSGRFQTPSIRRMVKKYLRAIGLNNARLTCHSLRHTFATLALENNAPLLAVQKAMRHANINTTTIYTHMLDRLTNGAESYIDLE